MCFDRLYQGATALGFSHWDVVPPSEMFLGLKASIKQFNDVRHTLW